MNNIYIQQCIPFVMTVFDEEDAEKEAYDIEYFVMKPLFDNIQENYDIGLLYYPGSGFDSVPKDILGIDRVVHVSLEEQNMLAENYFSKLGGGMKVRADYRAQIFKETSFDATLLYGIPMHSAIAALPEFRRVTKPDGLIIVEPTKIYGERIQPKFIRAEMRKYFEPVRRKLWQGPFVIYKNKK